MKYVVSEEEEIVLDFGDIGNSFFLIGLLNEFVNQLQTVGDSFFEEISWKQCFVLICMNAFQTPPTIKELSEVVGCSHQNLKQILIKLEKAGFVRFEPDTIDKRKQRILLTQKTMEFNESYDKPSAEFMSELFQKVEPQELQVTIATIQKLDEQIKKMRVKE